MSAPLDDRRARLLAGLDLRHDRGFEVGPLDSPVVPKEGADVVYLDHASTEDLRRKYAEDPNVGDIVAVDAVWGSAVLSGVLADVLERRGPFRYGVASHVIEHVPDVVGWLDQIAAVLEPGGTLHLAIPDKRFCFDFHRTASDVAEMVAAHLEGRTRPSTAAVFDFWSKYTAADADQLWDGARPAIGAGQDDLAMTRAREANGAEDYFDVHCWVFTPRSFLDALDRLGGLGLVRFVVKELRPTTRGELEFVVILERLPDELDPATRLDRQRDAIGRARRGLEVVDVEQARGQVQLSSKERGLIDAKRRVATSLRAGLARARTVVGRATR